MSMCVIVNPGYGGGPGPLGVVTPLSGGWGEGGVDRYFVSRCSNEFLFVVISAQRLFLAFTFNECL